MNNNKADFSAFEIVVGAVLVLIALAIAFVVFGLIGNGINIFSSFAGAPA